METDRPISVQIAAEIRKLLFLRGMTGTQLGEKAGMTQPYISRRLTGATKFDIDDLAAIATALDVQLSDLLPTQGSARAADKAYSPPLPDRPTAVINRPRHLPIRCAPRPAPNGQPVTRQSVHSGHGDRRPVIQPWTHDGVAA